MRLNKRLAGDVRHVRYSTCVCIKSTGWYEVIRHDLLDSSITQPPVPRSSLSHEYLNLAEDLFNNLNIMIMVIGSILKIHSVKNRNYK